ncbi:MAG: hypothetical protein K9L30_15560 [Desulfobacterales bacterium]|nr:hypothetical protein [Desulfobacterales bacterium]
MVKITESEIIKSSEQDLIDAITGDLDWSAIESIFKDKHNLKIQDDVEYSSGDLVVHDNRIAYKLDFDVKVTLSVLFDRDGNYISLATSGEITNNQEDNHDDSPDAASQTGSDLAEVQIPEDATDKNNIQEDTLETQNDNYVDPEAVPNENISEMASQIADMISEINE